MNDHWIPIDSSMAFYCCCLQDKDGLITVADLEKVMVAQGQTLTKEEMLEMVAYADADEDGALSFEEFFMVVAE